MLPMEQFRYIPIEQKAAAASEDYQVHLGWQPDLIEVVNVKAAGREAAFYRHITDAGELCLLPDAANDMDQDAANGITLIENGFKFGQNAFFKENDAKLAFKCYRNLESTVLIDLADTVATEANFGDGKQFKVLESGFTLAKGQPVKHGNVEVSEG